MLDKPPPGGFLLPGFYGLPAGERFFISGQWINFAIY
jgi:hypothetical protein